MDKIPKGVPRGRTAAFWGVCCLGGVLVLLAAGAVIPCMVPAKATAQKNACVNNLRMLDRAKEEWSLETKAEKGAVVTMIDVEQYLREVPQCPGRGVYSLEVVGEMPKCSLAAKGHRL